MNSLCIRLILGNIYVMVFNLIMCVCHHENDVSWNPVSQQMKIKTTSSFVFKIIHMMFS